MWRRGRQWRRLAACERQRLLRIIIVGHDCQTVEAVCGLKAACKALQGQHLEGT